MYLSKIIEISSSAISAVRCGDFPCFPSEILARGQHVITKVNGATAVDVLLVKERKSGRLYLQQRGAKTVVKFRKIEIMELPPDEPGWVQLFNGKDHAGWSDFKPGNCKVEDEVLVLNSPCYLETDKRYQNFHLRLQAKVNPGGTGAVDFRFNYKKSQAIAYVSAQRDYGKNVIFKNADRIQTIGALGKEPVPADTWCTLEVIADGKQVTVKVNGQTTAEGSIEEIAADGKIILSAPSFAGGTVVHFRKIEIKELPPSATEPFVVLAKGTRTETRHASLAAAVVWAQSGDTIEIRGDGPFVIRPIYLQKALAIRAGGGFRPHLKYQPTDPKARDSVLYAEAPLVLEGLTLERAANPGAEDVQLGTFVLSAKNAPLHVAHCRLMGMKTECSVRYTEMPGGSLRNSEILGDSYTGLSCYPVSSSVFTFENNLIAVKTHGFLFVRRSADVGKAEVKIRHNTVRCALPLNYADERSLDLEELEPKSPGLRLDAVGNVLHGSTPFYFSPVHKSLSLEKAAPLLPKLLSFQDDQNLYALTDKTKFLLVNRQGENGVRSFETLAEWHQFWGIAKSTSQVGTPVYQGGDVLAKALIAPNRLTLADFRLAAGSPGKGAGPGGKDLGADVDLVGPGPAYEKWRGTPAYQEWRKQADALMTR